MMIDPAGFRLNLEQQKKLAKELLKAARAGDEDALNRLAKATQPPKLADAQAVIAHELGLPNWPALKTHILSLDKARASIEAKDRAPDADVPTLHLRCGSDIRTALQEAGFSGEFLEVSYPYCHGPVTIGPGHFEREARFIEQLAGKHMGVSFEAALARRHQEEQALAASAAGHERIVLWMEHDCFDQLVLIRCLADFAEHGSPPILELVGLNHFPGRAADGRPIRFLGLGQLPSEALRMLWDRRQPVTRQQLALAKSTWAALTDASPVALAAMMRSGTPHLPHLAEALHRLLNELPSIETGLGMTERLVLETLAEGTTTIHRLWESLTYQRDPLFFATNLILLLIIHRLEQTGEPLITRIAGEDEWKDELSITATGTEVVAGEQDFLRLQPSSRWIGGVEIGEGRPDWRWDERNRKAARL